MAVGAPGVELGTGYVSIVASTRGLGRQLSGDFGKFGDEGGQSFTSRFAGRLAGLTKTAVKTGAAVGTAVAGAAVVSGFKRLQALEEAEKRLDSMGVSVKQNERLMAALNETLTGTPYALSDGATAMAGFVSAGVDLDRIPKILDSVTDAAAFGQAPLGEVADIFQKVSLNGKATTEMLNQLQYRGIPATALLASALGQTGEEFSKFVSDGKLTSDVFFSAWEEGAQGFGEQNIQMAGAAQNAGEVVRGAWGNMMTALARLGARALDPLYERLPGFLDGVKDRIDSVTESIGPMVDRFVESGAIEDTLGRVSGAARRVRGWIDRVAKSPLWARLRDNTADRFASIWENLGDTWAGIWPSLQRIGGSLARATAAIGVSTWEVLLTTLDVLSELLLITLVPVLENLANFMDDHPGIVTAVVGAYTAWRIATLTLSAAQGALNLVMAANPIVLVALGLAALVAGLVLAYQNVDWFRDAVDRAWAFIQTYLWPILQEVAGFLGAAFVRGFELGRDAVGWLVDKISALWGWIDEHLMPVFDAVASLLGTILGPAFDGVTGLVSTFFDMLFSLWEHLDGPLTTAFNWVVDFLRDTWGQIWEGASLVFGPLIDVLETVLGKIVELLENAEALIERLGDIPGALRDNIPDIPGTDTSGIRRPGWRDPGGLIGGLDPRTWGRAEGGFISGGTPGKDSVPALLMPGEYVLRKSAVDQLGLGVVEALNDGKIPGFAEGGGVSGGTVDISTVDDWATAVVARLAKLPGEIEAATLAGLTAWTAKATATLTALAGGFTSWATATKATVTDQTTVTLATFTTWAAATLAVKAAWVTGWLGHVDSWANQSQSKVTAFTDAVTASLRAAGDTWVAGMASVADRLVTALTTRLRTGGVELGQIVGGYAKSLADGINPILEAIGEKRVKFAAGGEVLRLAEGGYISGGTPGKDSVPALLMPGEVVIRKASVDKFGLDNMLALNNGHLPGYAKGGVVGRTGNPTIDNLNPLFLAQWNAFNASQGGRFTIGSGWRDSARQAYLYDRWIRRVPGQAQAARPGTSNHEFGLAIDHTPHSSAASRAAAAAFKLRYPMSFEPWHIEPNDARGMRGTGGFAMDLPAPPGVDRDGLFADAARASMKHMHDKANDWMMKAFTASFAEGDYMAGAEMAGPWIRAAMAATGVPESWFTGLMTIARRESNFNPRAVNNWDINAKRGIPSKGLMQTIQPTFDAHKLPGMGDIFNPIHNAAAAIRYILSRYGDISKVQQANPLAAPKGYGQGGFVHANSFDSGGTLRPGWNVVRNDTGADEPLVPAGRGPVMQVETQNFYDGADLDLLTQKLDFAAKAGRA